MNSININLIAVVVRGKAFHIYIEDIFYDYAVSPDNIFCRNR